MTLKNEPRREPSLADLEAFERLLRDSLKADGTEPAAVAAPAASPPPQPAITADNAMAEFNRLVEAPVVFEQPGDPPSVSRISAIEQALRADLDKPAPAEPDPVLARDPLLDFEEELRRFEAMSRPPAPLPANPVEPVEPLRGDYPGEAQVAAAAPAWAPTQPAVAQPAWAHEPQPIIVPDAVAPSSHDALAAAENRLNAEAEAAAYAGGAAMAAGAAAGTKRSRGIFFALGGVAVAGLAVIGGVTAFSGSKNASTANNGKVPVVAAKPEPAKEKPANPGGLEVPDQNKQVLAARNAPAADSRPAQVVNQTEQPVDLNQIARRDSVRVVAPSPFQPTSGSGDTVSAPGAGTTPATAPAPGEPRRVQSVRIADPVAPPPAVTPVTPPPSAAPAIGAGALVAIGAGAAATGRPATPPALPPGGQAAIRPQPPVTPPASVPTPPAPPAAAEPPKVETRPQSPVTPPRPAANANPPQRPAANNSTGPLPLSNNRPATPPAAAPANPAPRVATAPAAGGGGAFAIQLASRPSEADAQNAVRQLGQRFSGQIGGKAPVVVRGEANGQTVYRVRVTGFAQADATAACDKIRAAGGACFVTRQ